MKKIFTFILITVLCFGLFGCVAEKSEKDLWENAMYMEDSEFGDGKTSISVQVAIDEKTITFKVNTDKKMLGEALMEHKLIDGDIEAYGLYVKEVNGIRADYNEDKAYWAITAAGESVMTGVDAIEIKSGDKFEFTYTRG